LDEGTKYVFCSMQNERLPNEQGQGADARQLWQSLKAFIHRLASIEEGTDEQGSIEGIRRDVEFKGVNVWILVASIFIASIGLNTNATAVIIGAMLISPLMGPIIGTGLAVGIMDFALLKKSLRNFATTVAISILTSTLYFAISPLSEVQSELLARTTPTIFDVGIAFFGGLAGIVAGSRREKSNVVPGVAIATALMPPLCTAGFGLATGNLSFFFGAMYLFFINSVFISFATILIVRYLKFNRVGFVDARTEKRARYGIYLFLLITIIPSIFIGYNVIQQSIFKTKAMSFVQDYLEFPNRQVIKTELTYGSDSSTIEISLLGAPLSRQEIDIFNNKLLERGLRRTQLIVHQAGSVDGEAAVRLNQELRAGILEDLYKRNEAALQNKDEQIQLLEQELLRYRLSNVSYKKLAQEIQVQYPKVEKVGFSRLAETDMGSMKTDTIPTILVRWREYPGKAREQQLARWLQLRLDLDTVRVLSY
jgi:uncharacterized hydrophobic protein (TIGR00271 family)